MSPSPRPLERERIPVYLLTGYLGSGKTTLLAAWLQQSELADSALIINEVGEVGLDNHLLSGAVESSALVANTCICCTGLPGLEEALADLFWSRLHRKIKPFAAVIIETTGLAHPDPILDIFEHDPLLRERYQLAGVITTLSATSGMQVLAQHGEAGAQVTAAQLVIITKTDLVPVAALESLQAAVRALNSHAALATSAQASLRAATLLELLASSVSAKTRTPIPAAPETHDSAQHPHTPHSEQQADSHEGMHHHAQALFVPLPHPLPRQGFCWQLDHWIHRHAPGLLRVKGLVQLDDGSLVTAQWSLGDTRVDMVLHSTARDTSRPVQLGLTVIAKEDLAPSAVPSLVRATQPKLTG